MATPKPYALIAYDDPDRNGDYDATTWTAPLEVSNRLALQIGELKPGMSEVRLVVDHVNGSTSLYRFRALNLQARPAAFCLVESLKFRSSANRHGNCRLIFKIHDHRVARAK